MIFHDHFKTSRLYSTVSKLDICLCSLELVFYQAKNYLAFFTENAFTENAVCEINWYANALLGYVTFKVATCRNIQL